MEVLLSVFIIFSPQAAVDKNRGEYFNPMCVFYSISETHAHGDSFMGKPDRL